MGFRKQNIKEKRRHLPSHVAGDRRVTGKDRKYRATSPDWSRPEVSRTYIWKVELTEHRMHMDTWRGDFGNW